MLRCLIFLLDAALVAVNVPTSLHATGRTQAAALAAVVICSAAAGYLFGSIAERVTESWEARP